MYLMFFFFFFIQMKNILSIEKEKLDRACTSLHIPPFSADEYTFLIEYHKILTPVAVALKTPEANKHTRELQKNHSNLSHFE